MPAAGVNLGRRSPRGRIGASGAARALWEHRIRKADVKRAVIGAIVRMRVWVSGYVCFCSGDLVSKRSVVGKECVVTKVWQ